MPRMTHTEARALFEAAFLAKIGRPGTLKEIEPVQGVGYLETGYASGWKAPGAGSWNFGAIQSSRPPCAPATSFTYTDTHPNPDGTSTPYSICFKKYPSAQAGAEDLVRVMYIKRPTVLAAAATGDLYKVSEALLDTHYYEGFGPTRESRIRNHYKALQRAVEGQRKELETGPTEPPPGPPVVGDFHEGSQGPTVLRLQQRIMKHDGSWGPVTTAALKATQRAKGVPETGVLDEATKKALKL